MNQKYTIKLFVFLFSFFLLFSVVQLSFQASAMSNNGNENQLKIYQSDPLTSQLFNVHPGTELVYNVTDALFEDMNQYNVTNRDDMSNEDIQVGQFVPGEQFIFRFERGLMEEFSDPPKVEGYFGSIRGQSFWQEFRFDTRYNEINQSLNTTEGPPLAYFVLPADTNYTEAMEDFQAKSFIVVNGTDTFSVNYTNSSFQLDVSWNKTSGIMESYYFNSENPANSTENVTLGFELVLHFNPIKYMPYFGNQAPLLFYNFDQILIGENNTIDLENDDPQNHDYGYFEEGQIAQVELEVWDGRDGGGPGYEGFIQTMTGWSQYRSPFGSGPNECPPEDQNCQPPPPPSLKVAQQNPPPDNQGPGGPDEPPFLAFLFPISDNDGWFADFKILMEAEQKGATFTYNSTIFSIFMQAPDMPEINITSTFSRDTGVLLHYEMFSGMPGPNNVFVPYNLEISLYSAYDLSLLSPFVGVNEGDQFEYLVDTLLVNGENRTDTVNGEGYIEEGQSVHIRIDSINVTHGLNITTITQSVTSFEKSVVNFDDAFDDEGGPLFFLPLLPLDDDGLFWDILEDIFGGVFEATVVSTLTEFSVEFVDIDFGEGSVMNLFAQWDKSNGLLMVYNFSIVNPSNPALDVKLSITYVGTSTGDVYVAPSTLDDSESSSSPNGGDIASTPGFELIAFFIGMVVVTRIVRNRKD